MEKKPIKTPMFRDSLKHLLKSKISKKRFDALDREVRLEKQLSLWQEQAERLEKLVDFLLEGMRKQNHPYWDISQGEAGLSAFREFKEKEKP